MMRKLTKELIYTYKVRTILPFSLNSFSRYISNTVLIFFLGFGISSNVTAQTIDALASTCLDATPTLNFTPSVITPVNYSWSITAGTGAATLSNAAIAMPMLTFTTAGTIDIMVSADDGVTTEMATLSVTINALPTAGLVSSDADNTICAGESVTFTASGGAMYEFFLNGVSTAAASATTTYTTTSLANSDVVTVVVTDATPCSATSAGITTTVNPSPTITPSNNGPICAGATVTLNETGGSGVTWAWTSNGSATFDDPTANSPIATGAVNGEIFSVIVTGANSCQTTGTTTVTVNALPTITLGTSPSVCMGTTAASLPYTATTDNPNSYIITYDAAAVTAGFSNVAATALPATPVSLVVPGAAAAGTYNGTITVTNTTTGCIGAATAFTVEVTSTSTAPTITVADFTICAGDAIQPTITAAGSGGGTGCVDEYRFSTDNGASWGGWSATLPFFTSSAGTTLIETQRNCGNACSSTTFQLAPITVSTPPTAAITGNATVCATATTTLDAGAGFASYAWAHSVTGQTVTVGAGTYTVTVTDNNQCTASASHTISAITAPTPTVTSVAVCSGATGTIDAGAGYTAYIWSNGATSQTITATPNTYTVTVTAANGCTGTASGTITGTDTVDPTMLCQNVTLPLGGTGSVTVTTADIDNGSTDNCGSLTLSITGQTTFTCADIGTPVTVSLNGDDGNGNITSCSATVTVTGSVTSTPAQLLSNLPSGTSVCAGTQITFTAGPTGATSYEFFVNNVSQGAASTNPVFSSTTLVNGDVVTAAVIDASSCGSASVSPPIVVGVLTITPQLLSSDADNIICAGQSITFTAGGGAMYEFFKGSASLGAASTNNSYSSATLVTGDSISVKVTDANGCSASHPGYKVTVTPSFVAGLSSDDSDNIICINDAIQFTATPTGAANYEYWVNGNIVQSSVSATLLTSTLSDKDTVRVRVTNAIGGCTITAPMAVVTVNDIVPTLTTASGNGPFCTGDIITFLGGGGSIYEFLVNGVVVQGVSGVNSYTTNTLNSGDLIKVRVSDGYGCIDSMMMNIALTAAPSIAIAPNVTSICAGNPVTYTASGGSTYEFFVNGTSVQGPSATATYTTSSLVNGDIVSVTGSNASSCSVNVIAATVAVSNTPTAGTVSGSNALCIGSTTVLSTSSTVTTGTWLSSNNAVATISASGTVTAVAAGTVNITYTVTSGGCTSTSAPFALFVSPTGSLIINTSDADNTICAGEAVTLTASGGTGAVYTWTSSSGIALPNSASITVTPTSNTTYTVSAVGGTCAGTSSAAIIVNSIPVAGAITGSTAGSTTLCNNTNLSLVATTTGGTISWSSSDPALVSINAVTGVLTTTNNLTLLPATAAITYTVTNNGCSTTSTPYQVTVNDCTTNAPGTNLKIAARALLEGPYDEASQLMNDDLRLLPTATVTTLPATTVASSPFPLTEPYTALGFTQVGGGGETTTNGVLALGGGNAIVDWVFLELRDATNPATVVATKSALIQRDGDIVNAADGVSPVEIPAVNASYYLAVRHRNHLGIRSATPIAMSAATSATVDMSTTVTGTPGYMAVAGTHPVDTINNRVVMWGGDASGDGQTIFTGPNNDRDAVFFDVFDDPANTTSSYNHIRPGYFLGDTNLDGKVKYQGPTNDLDRLMFFNVLFYPSSIGTSQIIYQQLP